MEDIKHFSEADVLSEIPDDVLISALKEFGQYGRHNRRYNPTTHNAPVRAPMPLTDYQATFKATTSPRPRSSKKPPPTPRNPHPAPMSFDTNQRTEFKNLGHVERVKPIVHEEQYVPPQVTLDTKTFYSQEFTPKKVVPEPTAFSAQGMRKDALRLASLPMEGRTTNKETYKPWQQQPALAFGELPSFTGSILFPERKPLPESTMRYSYQGKFVPPVPLIKMASPSIKLEGDHLFDTTHKDTYKPVKGDHRVLPMMQKAATPGGPRGRFHTETQSKVDFPGYKGRQPMPPAPAEPAPTTIDLKFNNRRSFNTENRTMFTGYNVVQHPAPKPCKVADEEFSPPTVKFETETSQKRDYQPIDVSGGVAAKATMPQSSMAAPGEATFDGTTMNNEFFKNWGVGPRVRYGDFHENTPYIPPQQPFKGQSVTKSSFVAKKAEPVTFYKPAERPNSNANAKVDYTTSYGSEYQKKQAPMSRSQIYLIQQELERRQREKKIVSAPVASKPIAVK